MRNDLQVLVEKVGALTKGWGRPSALIGGLAIAARVRVRVTKDADVAIAVPPGTESELLRLATSTGFTYDPVETGKFMPGGLVRLWLPSEGKVLGLDLLFANEPFFEEVVRRATTLKFWDVELTVATVEDLLLMKLDANRPNDWDDAIAIKDAHGPTLDRAYIDRQAEYLDVKARVVALLDP